MLTNLRVRQWEMDRDVTLPLHHSVLDVMTMAIAVLLEPVPTLLDLLLSI